MVYELRKRGNGYLYFIDKNHPLARKESSYMVYYHRHIASLKIGRWLNEDEHVHHIDGNTYNNDPDNLEIMSNSEHTSVHHPGNKRAIKKCMYCHKEYEQIAQTQKYCSDKCAHLGNRKVNRPSKEELEQEIMAMNWLALGRKYGVSDNAVRKWAKDYSIPVIKRKYTRSRSSAD